MTTQQIVKFVKDFLLEHQADSELVSAWTHRSNSLALTKLIAGKKPRKKRFENIKRSKSAYLHFCDEERPRIPKTTRLADGTEVNVSTTDITCQLGVRWNALKNSRSAADVQRMDKYEDLANNDKQRYLAEKQNVLGKLEKNTIKKPLSAYLFFCQAERENVINDNPTMSATEVVKELSVRWNVLKAHANAPGSHNAGYKNQYDQYVQQCEYDKRRYAAAKKEKQDNTNSAPLVLPDTSNEEESLGNLLPPRQLVNRTVASRGVNRETPLAHTTSDVGPGTYDANGNYHVVNNQPLTSLSSTRRRQITPLRKARAEAAAAAAAAEEAFLTGGQPPQSRRAASMLQQTSTSSRVSATAR